MSIFKETFKNFVFNQLKIREAALNQHSNRSLRADGGKVPDMVGEDASTRLPLGAFYTNTTSRQCTIRMSSGANLKEENNLIDAGDPDKLSLAKEGLAIRYILESGIQSKGQDTSKGFRPQPTVSDNNGTRYEFLGDKSVKNRDKFGSGYGSTYGDPFIRSEAADGFGIVPMPGIIDAEIRTKTAYGSLRDAKINFVCHNRRQLDILDALYMRPGMPILLEWGWDPYISNKGKIESYFPYLWEWFDSNSSINKINKTIHKRIEDSGGNYDGFVGFVKNFEMTSRPDGGYDCTTELAAMGETLEGLKGRNDGRVIKSKDDKDITVDNLEFYLNALYNYCEMFSRDDLVNKTYRISESDEAISKDTLNSIKAISKDIIPLLKGGLPTDFDNEVFNQGEIFTWGDKFDRINEEQTKFIDENIEPYLDKYLLFKNEALGLKGNEGTKYESENNTQSTEHYIKWELLVKILNKLVIDTYQEDSNPSNVSPITEIRYREERELLEYSKYIFKNGKTIKVNPREDDPTTITVNLSDLMDMSVDPSKCLLPHQIDKIVTRSDGSIIDYLFGDNITEIEEGSNKRNISDIFISLDYLLKLYRRTRYKGDEINEDFSLFSFLQTVWEKDINNACAGIHNFVLHTEKTRGNVIRVIDMQQSELNPSNLYKFKINGKESIVRDFNYNTTIDSKLSATVAIAAQSPSSINDLDAISFAALNRNIEYRFFKENTSEKAKEENRNKKSNKYDEDVERLKKMLAFLYNYRISILKGEFKENDETLETSTAKRYIQSIESSVISLKSRYSKDDESADPPQYKGFRKNDPNSVTKSTIIPLKFNAQIDGIGGLVIGNIFKVDKNFLPKGYEQEDIAFAVMTENQKITAGQDWITEFSGQLILLDLPNENNDDLDFEDTDNGSYDDDNFSSRVDNLRTPGMFNQETGSVILDLDALGL